jgi:Family of unknown function (DUF6152)
MNRNPLVFLFFACLFACAAQLYAHHSFTATYHEDQTVKIEGKLIQFQFRNPHSFVQVLDEKGICCPSSGEVRER